jgi:hypothetical protein
MSISLYNANNTLIFNNGSYQTDDAICTGQSWQSPTRVVNTLYTNSTTKPITVAITVSIGNNLAQAATIDIDGLTLGRLGCSNGNASGGNNRYQAQFYVKPGSTYKFTTVSGNGDPSIVAWAELR